MIGRTLALAATFLLGTAAVPANPGDDLALPSAASQARAACSTNLGQEVCVATCHAGISIGVSLNGGFISCTWV